MEAAWNAEAAKVARFFVGVMAVPAVCAAVYACRMARSIPSSCAAVKPGNCETSFALIRCSTMYCGPVPAAAGAQRHAKICPAESVAAATVVRRPDDAAMAYAPSPLRKVRILVESIHPCRIGAALRPGGGLLARRQALGGPALPTAARPRGGRLLALRLLRVDGLHRRGEARIDRVLLEQHVELLLLLPRRRPRLALPPPGGCLGVRDRLPHL